MPVIEIRERESGRGRAEVDVRREAASGVTRAVEMGEGAAGHMSGDFLKRVGEGRVIAPLVMPAGFSGVTRFAESSPLSRAPLTANQAYIGITVEKVGEKCVVTVPTHFPRPDDTTVDVIERRALAGAVAKRYVDLAFGGDVWQLNASRLRSERAIFEFRSADGSTLGEWTIGALAGLVKLPNVDKTAADRINRLRDVALAITVTPGETLVVESAAVEAVEVGVETEPRVDDVVVSEKTVEEPVVLQEADALDTRASVSRQRALNAERTAVEKLAEAEAALVNAEEKNQRLEKSLSAAVTRISNLIVENNRLKEAVGLAKRGPSNELRKARADLDAANRQIEVLQQQLAELKETRSGASPRVRVIPGGRNRGDDTFEVMTQSTAATHVAPETPAMAESPVATVVEDIPSVEGDGSVYGRPLSRSDVMKNVPADWAAEVEGKQARPTALPTTGRESRGRGRIGVN